MWRQMAYTFSCRQFPLTERGISLWDCTADKLLAAMFMLARTFPLQTALNGHQLADYIEHKHKRWRHMGSKTLLFNDLDQPVTAENSAMSSDAKITDDDNASFQHCGRCNRSRKEVKPLVLTCTLPLYSHASTAFACMYWHALAYKKSFFGRTAALAMKALLIVSVLL